MRHDPIARMGGEGKIWDRPMDRYLNQEYITQQEDGISTRPGERKAVTGVMVAFRGYSVTSMRCFCYGSNT